MKLLSKRLVVIVCSVFILSIILCIHLRKGNFNLNNISSVQNANDISTTNSILNDDLVFSERYDSLFYYFVHSFVKYSSDDYALVNYPGMLSTSGNKTNQVEGTARTLPLIAAWVYSGRDSTIIVNGNKLNIVDLIRSSILSGTNPSSVNYWGDIHDYDQRILEAADIVRVLWLTKKEIWNHLKDNEKNQIALWLEQAASAKTVKNNWLLAPFIIQNFLQDNGYTVKVNYKNYIDFKKNYLEHGWFRDGNDGEVDFYNTWGISYDLFWISLITDYDNAFILKTLSESADFTSHLISKNGIPLVGRSICYRTAAPTPVLIEGLLKNDGYHQGLAKSALDYTWKYFVSHNALVSDTLSMGYFNNDKRFVDNYSGSGSCLWGIRSLVVAYMNDKKSYIWNGKYERLPIDNSDFIINADKLGWIVEGNKDSGEIRVIIPANEKNSPKINDTNKLKEVIWRVLGKAGRTNQHDIEYLKPYYSSLEPISDVE